MATEHTLIEAKASVGSIKLGQLEKYTDPTNEKYINFMKKKVVLYVRNKIKNMDNNVKVQEARRMGVIVVNKKEELKKVVE